MDQELNEELNEEEPKLTDPWHLPVFTNTIDLADGTTVKGHATLNADDDELWVTLDQGTDLTTAFGLFNNKKNTQMIVSHNSILSTITHIGYTKMILIREDAGRVKVLLKKP